MDILRPRYIEAVRELLGDISLGGPVNGPYSDLKIFGDVKTPPTEDEIQTKLSELQTAYDDLAYSRARQAEYPDMGTQLNKIYDDGITKWKSEMIDPVKAKWPKDNSGPK